MLHGYFWKWLNDSTVFLLWNVIRISYSCILLASFESYLTDSTRLDIIQICMLGRSLGKYISSERKENRDG